MYWRGPFAERRTRIIQINFRSKEQAAKISNIEDLEHIAKAFKTIPQNTPQIAVYFEFQNADELLLFCRTVSLMEKVHDVDTLEEKKNDVKLEIEALEVELGKLKEKKEKKRASEGG